MHRHFFDYMFTKNSFKENTPPTLLQYDPRGTHKFQPLQTLGRTYKSTRFSLECTFGISQQLIRPLCESTQEWVKAALQIPSSCNEAEELFVCLGHSNDKRICTMAQTVASASQRGRKSKAKRNKTKKAGNVSLGWKQFTEPIGLLYL